MRASPREPAYGGESTAEGTAASRSPGEPQQDGDVPPEAEAILERLRAAQAKRDGADHLYELTAEVGRSLTGFRHDQDIVTGEPSPYRVLAR